MLCGTREIGCKKTHLKLRFHENPFVHDIHLSCQIILNFCTEHGSDTAMLCAKFQNDFITGKLVNDEWHSPKIWVEDEFPREILYCHSLQTHKTIRTTFVYGPHTQHNSGTRFHRKYFAAKFCTVWLVLLLQFSPKFSQYTSHSLPVRASYGMYFVRSNLTWCSNLCSVYFVNSMLHWTEFNSLVPGRCDCNLKLVIFKLISCIEILSFSCEIALR